MTDTSFTRPTHRLEHADPACAEALGDLWTTPDGIASWWAADGFTVEVQTLELEPGGELVYTMTATGPEQIAFMEGAGMPASTVSPKTFTEVVPPRRLAYTSLADFIPDVEPYEFLTVIDLTPTQTGTDVVMPVE